MSNDRTCPVCRVTRISRYNTDLLCSRCASTTRDSGVTVPEWLWDSVPLRRALADVDLGAALAIIRNSAGLSQLDLACVIGWEQSAVARVECGKRGTLYDIRKLLAVVDALEIPRVALAPLLLGFPDATIENTEADVDRREFGSVLIGLGAAAGLDRLQIPSPVSSGHVRYLRATTDRLYRRDQIVGGGALITHALRHYARAHRMLNEAGYGERIGQELMSAAGELAVCVGWLAFDAGKQALSRRLYSEALLLAEEAGDDMLSVSVLEKMSLQAAHLAKDAHPSAARAAVRLSLRAADLARRSSSPRLHALIAAREALGQAASGDRIGFEMAIRRALREFSQGVGSDDPVWLQFVTPAEIGVQEAKGQSYLGNLGVAVQLFQAALEDPDLSPRNRVNYTAQLAGALAREGDAAGAVDRAVALLPALEGQIASPRTLGELGPVRALAGRDGVDEFSVRYDKLIQASAA